MRYIIHFCISGSDRRRCIALKKYPLLIIIIISTAAVSITGWLLNFGVVKSLDGNDTYKITDIGVQSAVHEAKLYASGLSMSDGKIETAKNADTGVSDNNMSGNSVNVTSDSTSDNNGTAPDNSEKVSENAAASENTVPFVSVVSMNTVSADDSYFNDACFIGDSRVKGFGMYSGLTSTFYAATGYQVYEVFEKKIVPTVYGKMTVPEALNGGIQYKKIYLMFGLNEMGWGNDDMFAQEYYKLIDMIKQEQPDAIIYVQQIIHVTREKSDSSPMYSNAAIDYRNEKLREIAENEHVHYLQLNEVFTDENDALPDEYTADGIHIKSAYMQIWKDYLKSHTATE